MAVMIVNVLVIMCQCASAAAECQCANGLLLALRFAQIGCSICSRGISAEFEGVFGVAQSLIVCFFYHELREF